MTASWTLLALHGFLGRASEWDGVAGCLPDASVSALDLWPILDQPDVSDWPSMSRALDLAIADTLRQHASKPAFLVAYSFGARLALASSTLSSPASPVRGACFVSCNPGLPEDAWAARESRRESDATWVERIRRWPEDDLWRAWDAQPVFGGPGRARHRVGLPATREALARALGRFSLATQPDFLRRLQGWPGPLLWVTGAGDSKFSGIASRLAGAGVPATFVTCEGAGHRVPWDNPIEFSRTIRAWVAAVMETHR